MFLAIFLCLFSAIPHNLGHDAIIRVGLIVKYEDDLTRGVKNQTIWSMVSFMKENFVPNFAIETELIHDLDSFVSEIEDDPRECEFYTAIVSATDCDSSQILYDLVATYCPSTVILSIHERTCPRPPKHNGFGFPVTTAVSDVIPMLIDMRYDFLKEWNHVNLIHDETFNSEMVFDFVQGFQHMSNGLSPSTVTVYHMQGVRRSGGQSLITDHKDCLTEKSLMNLEFTSRHLAEHIENDTSLNHFIMIGRSRSIENMVEEAHNRSLLGRPRRWLLIFTDTLRKKSFWDNISPILTVTDTAIVRREVSKYSTCGEMSEGCQFRLAFETLRLGLKTLAEQSSELFVNETRDARRLRRNKLLHEIKSQLGNPDSAVQFCGNCDRYVMQVFERKEKKELKPWIKKKQAKPSTWVPNQNFDVKVRNTAEWSPFKGYLGKHEIFPSPHAAQFTIKHMKIAIFQQVPRVRVEWLPNGVCNVTGATPEILKLLGERLNFTIEWDCSQKELGYLAPNGSWTGVMGLLVAGKVQMAGNGVWRLPSNNNTLEWSIPYTEESVVMMVQKSTEDHRWLFLLPFTWDVWYGIGLSAILVAPFTYYVNRRCKYYDYCNIRRDKGLFTMSNCIWYTYGALCGQGGDYLPPAIGTRTIVAFWWLFVIVTATTYSGNLVACLTFPKVLQPIQNAQDLLNAWFMDWATQVHSQIQEVAGIEKYQPIKLLRRELEYMDFDRNREWIFEEVADDDLAWLGLDEEIRHYVSVDYLTTGVCHMHPAKDDVYRTPVRFAFAKGIDKGSIEAFDREIRLLGVTGYIAHWLRYYAQLGNDCLQPLIVYAGDVLKIETYNMYGGYLILGCGLSASFVMLITEIAYMRCVRPLLPASFQTSVEDMKDYYTKISVGYGYSNARAISASKERLLPAQTPRLANMVMAHHRNAMEKSGKKIMMSSSQSIAGTPVIANPQYNTTYNTNANYNFYQYENSKTNFRNRFGIQ